MAARCDVVTLVLVEEREKIGELSITRDTEVAYFLSMLCCASRPRCRASDTDCAFPR